MDMQYAINDKTEHVKEMPNFQKIKIVDIEANTATAASYVLNLPTVNFG